MDLEEVKNAANWCLNCKTKPCSLKGCPMQTKIPEFLVQVKEENYEKAYQILQENNIFSYVCGIVCPQEEQCEGSCVRGIKQEPTKIGKLETFVNSWAKENKVEYEYEVKEKNGKKVAIVGSGPAGIECAVELLKEGYDVTIYEKDEKFGGILVYGIPDFRLPKNIVENIIKKLEKMGANLINNTKLGKDITINELQDKYDAVFLGIGSEISSTYKVSENSKLAVYDSDTFLRAYNNKEFIKNLGKVVVIGGGNVAMDSSRVAKKMGAEEVKILYRRDRNHMPAREEELQDALREGILFKELVRVISANNEENKMTSLNCIKTEIVDGKAKDIDGTEFTEEANTLVFAIGLKPNKDLLLSQGIELDDWGMVKIDEKGKTNLDKVYSGGDSTESKSTVCRAIAAGKRAALGIIEELK